MSSVWCRLPVAPLSLCTVPSRYLPPILLPADQRPARFKASQSSPGPDRPLAVNCVALSEPWKTWARFCSSFLPISPYTFSTKLHSWTPKGRASVLFHLSCIFSPWEHASIIKLFCSAHFLFVLPHHLIPPPSTPRESQRDARLLLLSRLVSPSLPTRLGIQLGIVFSVGHRSRSLSTCRYSHGAPAAQEGWP